MAPHTTFGIERLATEGVKKLKVICPVFIMDYLEALEEIAREANNCSSSMLEYALIPCINTHPAWVKWLNDKIERWKPLSLFF